ncbi:hypothetical protein E2320_000894 [Naja naja]|nr:hypothetical protein E2320_000894 [Naja naja]
MLGAAWASPQAGSIGEGAGFPVAAWGLPACLPASSLRWGSPKALPPLAQRPRVGSHKRSLCPAALQKSPAQQPPPVPRLAVFRQSGFSSLHASSPTKSSLPPPKRLRVASVCVRCVCVFHFFSHQCTSGTSWPVLADLLRGLFLSPLPPLARSQPRSSGRGAPISPTHPGVGVKWAFGASIPDLKAPQMHYLKSPPSPGGRFHSGGGSQPQPASPPLSSLGFLPLPGVQRGPAYPPSQARGSLSSAWESQWLPFLQESFSDLQILKDARMASLSLLGGRKRLKISAEAAKPGRGGFVG